MALRQKRPYLIMQSGLKPMNRQYVHLSMDVETAVQVGSRKAPKPIILTVNAKEAYQAGVPFYEGHDLVWLADAIPPQFIQEPESN